MPVRPADVQNSPNLSIPESHTLEATGRPASDINDTSTVLSSSIKLQVPEPAKADRCKINDARKKLGIEWIYDTRVSVKKNCIPFICMYYT